MRIPSQVQEEPVDHERLPPILSGSWLIPAVGADMTHSPSKTCSRKSLSCSPFLTKGSHGVLKIHLNPWRFLTYQSQEGHFKKLWDWKGGSMVKSTSCFSRGPNFGPQSPYQVAPAAIPSFPRALCASISATLKRILQEQQTRHLSLESQSPFALASSLYGLSNHLSSFIPHLSVVINFTPYLLLQIEDSYGSFFLLFLLHLHLLPLLIHPP